MTQLKCHGAIEDIQDYISSDSGLGYTTGVNFVIGDITDLATLGATKAIDLTMYDEGGTMTPSGRRWHMHRNMRFVFKGAFGQGAVNEAWKFVDWLGTLKTFTTPNYRVWLENFPKLPSIIGATKADTYLADAVAQFLLLSKTG